MFNYSYLGLKIRSDLEFLQLMKDDIAGVPDVLIQANSNQEALLEQCKQSGYEITPDFSWFANPTAYIEIIKGKKIIYTFYPDQNLKLLQAYILGYAMAMLCLQRGLLAIHCSAIAVNGKAYLISGESGSGKSTITSYFLQSEDNGFLADDMTVVGKDRDGIVYVWPAFPYQKLCKDAAIAQGYKLDELIYVDEYKDKYLVPCKQQFCFDKVPIGGMLYLYTHDEESVKYSQLHGIENFSVCINNLFLRRVLGKEKFAPYIGQKCLEIAAQVRACVIGRPKEVDSREEIISYVRNFINSK